MRLVITSQGYLKKKLSTNPISAYLLVRGIEVAQLFSGIIIIEPAGHSVTQMPHPLQ